MTSSKTILFFGTDEFSALSLRELIAKGFTIGAVITKPDARKGRGQRSIEPIVKTIAKEHGIAVWQPVNTEELINYIRTVKDPMGVLVSYGRIIPQSVIDLFNPGIINVHPSLLPLYRGPSPIEAAILNGDTVTGVTIMQLSKEMDAGPIYSQVTVGLSDTETTPELERQLGEVGAQELSLILPSIINGSLVPVSQDESVASYCQLLKKEDSTPDFPTLSAEQAERRVRAYLAFPKTKATILAHQIVITKAHIVNHAETALDIACADGRFLRVEELIGPSGRSMNAKAFLNGYS